MLNLVQNLGHGILKAPNLGPPKIHGLLCPLMTAFDCCFGINAGSTCEEKLRFHWGNDGWYPFCHFDLQGLRLIRLKSRLKNDVG